MSIIKIKTNIPGHGLLGIDLLAGDDMRQTEHGLGTLVGSGEGDEPEPPGPTRRVVLHHNAVCDRPYKAKSISKFYGNRKPQKTNFRSMQNTKK